MNGITSANKRSLSTLSRKLYNSDYPDRTFEVFFEFHKGIYGDDPQVLLKYPDDYVDTLGILGKLHESVFPIDFSKKDRRDDLSSHSEQIDRAIIQYTVVLTHSKSGGLMYCYCRYSPVTHICLCLVSQLYWTGLEELLDHIGRLFVEETSVLNSFLRNAYNQPLPKPNDLFFVGSGLGQHTIQIHGPDYDLGPALYSRHLVHLFNCVATPRERKCSDVVRDIIKIYASLLFERKVIFVSNKLGTLSACVLAFNALLYPMMWEHNFYPIVSQKHLEHCLTQPSPIFCGLPNVLTRQALDTHLNSKENGSYVLFDLDNSHLYGPHIKADVDVIPLEYRVVMEEKMKTSLSMSGGFGFREAFLKMAASILFGCDDAMILVGTEYSFDIDTFIASKSPDHRPFYELLRNSQMFQQFFERRERQTNLKLIPHDDFENELQNYGTTPIGLKLKTKAAQIKREQREKLKNIHNSVRNRSHEAMKDIKTKMDEFGSKTYNNSSTMFYVPSLPTIPKFERSRPSSFPGRQIIKKQPKHQHDSIDDLEKHYPKINEPDIPDFGSDTRDVLCEEIRKFEKRSSTKVIFTTGSDEDLIRQSTSTQRQPMDHLSNDLNGHHSHSTGHLSLRSRYTSASTVVAKEDNLIDLGAPVVTRTVDEDWNFDPIPLNSKLESSKRDSGIEVGSSYQQNVGVIGGISTLLNGLDVSSSASSRTLPAPSQTYNEQYPQRGNVGRMVNQFQGSSDSTSNQNNVTRNDQNQSGVNNSWETFES